MMQLFEEHKAEYEALKRPGMLKIGIQICAGDNRMQDGAVHFQMFDHFFDCAQQVEVSRVSVLSCCRGLLDHLYLYGCYT